MLWVFLPMTLGIITAKWVNLPLYIPLIFIIIITLLLYTKQWIATTYPLIFILGYLNVALFSPVTALEPQRDATLMLRVSSGNVCQILSSQLSDGSWQRMSNKILCYLPDSLHYKRIKCRGDVELIEPTNSYLATMKNKGVEGQLWLDKVIAIDPKSNIPLARRMNNWALERLKRLDLSDESFASAAAMGLARRDFLDSHTSEIYARSGTAHLLALSGLHLGIVLMLISIACYLIPLLRYGHIIADIISIVAIWLFALIAGLGDSVLRAAWMFSILQLASLLSRRYCALNALFAAAVAILLFDPLALYDLSFRLSFIAVAAILLVGAPLSRRLRSGFLPLDVVVSSIVIGVVATISTAPLISQSFGYISVLSPLTTFPLLLTLSAIIITVILWIIAPLQLLAPLASHVIEVAATIQNYTVEWFATWGWGYIDYRMSDGAVIVSYIIMVPMAIACSWALNFHRKKEAITVDY